MIFILFCSSIEHTDDSFDLRIASELDALDHLQLDSSVAVPTALQSTSQTIKCQTSGVRDDQIAPVVPVAMMAGLTSTGVACNEALCHNLIDLAADRNETEKPNNKDKGTYSDEVRIMEKVLGPKVSF